MIKFNDYKNCLLKDEVVLKLQQRFISKKYDVYTESINKIALSNNDDKRIVSSDKITSYPYGYKGKNALRLVGVLKSSNTRGNDRNTLIKNIFKNQ